MTKQLRHVMIDLETMGTTPQSAIVSIGAIVLTLVTVKCLKRYSTVS